MARSITGSGLRGTKLSAKKGRGWRLYLGPLCSSELQQIASCQKQQQQQLDPEMKPLAPSPLCVHPWLNWAIILLYATIWRHPPCGKREVGANMGSAVVPKVPLKDFSSFPGFTFSFIHPQMWCLKSMSALFNVIRGFRLITFTKPTTEVLKWKYGFNINLENGI